MSGGVVAQAPRLVGGRYELECPIGKGGIGEVWRARHVALNSRVAIKFLQLASAQKDSAKRRFTTEAQITAQLKTPNAVQVFDFGITDDGQPYLVMELLEGETLGRRLERVKRLGIGETARLLGQAARALQRAHQLGIVHRDFKPDNIVIFEDDEGRDQVKVLDFGVAKLVGALEDSDELEGEAAGGQGPSPSFTRTGTVLGTPLYMAPEQIHNAADVDLRSDIWAFGVVAFECLTGKAPFGGATLAELFERIQGGLHPSASFLEPSIPAGFDVWFDVACAPAPGKRFPNASVAWKHLTVALDLGANDASGSFPGLLDPHATSGERRVLVVQPAERPDESAPTLDVASDRPRELRVRTHGDDFASLQRIPLDGVEDMPRPSGESAAPLVTADPPSSADRRARTMLSWALGAGVVTLIGALVVWRATTGPSAASVPSPVGQASAEAPRSPADTGAPLAPSARAPDALPSPPPLASTALASSARRASPRLAASRAAPASLAVAAAQEVPAPPTVPAVTTPPAPSPPPVAATTTAVDPGSYR